MRMNTATSAMVLLAACLVSSHGFASGRALYSQHCAACHQENGRGLPPVYPSLQNNALIKSDADRVIAVIINGRAAMPGFATGMDAEQIADVVSFIRKHWDNNEGAVDVNRVKAILDSREDTGEPGRETEF